MSGEYLLQFLTWSLFVLIFAITFTQAIQRPSQATTNIALLFSSPALVSLISMLMMVGLVTPSPLLGWLSGGALLALPYLFVRLLDDFSQLSPTVSRIALATAGILIALLVLLPEPKPAWYTLISVAYFLLVLVYGTFAFARQSRRYVGVTRRRMESVALGTATLGGSILALGMVALLPGQESVWSRLSQLGSLAAGISFFLGFAPPSWLRRSWQVPELRAFLSRAGTLPYLPDQQSILAELEAGTAASLGVTKARIGLWDEGAGVLRFFRDGKQVTLDPGGTTAGRAFTTQRPSFSAFDTSDPGSFPRPRRTFETSILAAPITAGEKRLGVLVVYASRTPIFARDDLSLAQLLANQAAVILENRALLDEAAKLRAKTEVTHLKEDFLSAAAHDLRTPITVLLTQAQLMERQAQRQPGVAVDLAGVRRIITEARRLKEIVDELMDASRTEEGRLVGERERIDLAEAARSVCRSRANPRFNCLVEAPTAVIGEFDRVRILQLLDNLVENAMKYSPKGGDVRLRVWRDGDEARVTVTDRGIGILPSDLPHIFDRFHRGANVDDRRFAGMGLGLYICRGIVEGHGGRFWVTSKPDQGTTFNIALPAPQAVAGGVDHA